MVSRAVTDGLQSERWKKFVRAFRFLQADDVRLCRLKPCKQPILAFAQRIDVP
jgi:hypothetical protein